MATQCASSAFVIHNRCVFRGRSLDLFDQIYTMVFEQYITIVKFLMVKNYNPPGTVTKQELDKMLEIMTEVPHSLSLHYEGLHYGVTSK